jgi:hypothetical protein
VGNDSSIHCYRAVMVNDDNPSFLLSTWVVTVLNLAVNNDNEFAVVIDTDDDNLSSSSSSSPPLRKIKFTSLCIVDETSRKSTIAIGTSCGKIALIDVVLSSEVGHTDRATPLLRETIQLEAGTEDDNGKDTVIHAMCAGRIYENNRRILVGHSRGVTICDVSINASSTQVN